MLLQALKSVSHAGAVSKVASVWHARHRHKLVPRRCLHGRHLLHAILLRDAHVTEDEPLTQRSVLADSPLSGVAEVTDPVQQHVCVEHDLCSEGCGLGGSPAVTGGELTQL
jgi:hypothetical protein